MVLSAAAVVLCCIAASAVAQETASVRVTVPGKPALELTPEALAKMPRASAKASNHGVATVYEGVWLHDILKQAGAPQGQALRGKALSSYLLAEAQDGYQVVFSLGEFDPEFGGTWILLADSIAGAPLTGAMGRFRLVLPNDKHGSRSIRMLTRLEVVQLRK